MRKKYRSKAPSRLLSDVASTANTLSWKGCIGVGFAFFVVFYCLAPVGLKAMQDTQRTNMFLPLFHHVFTGQVHRVEWLGLAGLIVSLLIAGWKFFRGKAVSRKGLGASIELGKIGSRLLD